MNKDIVFWSVDNQVDFVNKDGKLSVDGAEEIKPTLAKLTDLAKEKDIQVINTCDWHDDNTEEISENPDFVNTFPEHCMKDTEGAKFIKETNPENPYIINHTGDFIDELKVKQSRNLILRKDKFDIFSGSDASENVLKQLNQNKFVVYGVAENVCVDFAVKGLLERGKEVYVVVDAIKGLPNIPSPLEEWEDMGARKVFFREVKNIIN